MSVAAALLFGMTMFTVGVVTGIYRERRRQVKAAYINQQPGESATTIPAPKVIPEYEEINLEIKRADIPLSGNAAYGCVTTPN